jgi:small conductance mechanosensitive channel
MQRPSFALQKGAAVGLALALALSHLATSVASAQEDAGKTQTVEQQIDALIEQLKTREAELEDLRQRAEGREDSAAAAILEKEISERRARYRRDVSALVDLVLTAEDAGADAAQARATAIDLLEKDAQSMRDRTEELNATIIDLLDPAEKGSGEEAAKARASLDEAITASNRLLSYMDANLDQRRKLGVDVQQEAETFAKRVEARAAMVAGGLQNTKQQIDEISSRPGAGDDAEAQKALTALKKHRDILAETQKLNVGLMDEYGLETAQLKQGLISATGKLSQDVLNKEVASGLIQDWFESAGEWLRSNGASLVFQALVFFLILLAFWILARAARGAVRRGIERSKVQVSSLARDFFIKMAGRLVLLIGIIIAIAQLGVEVGPLLAGLGIAGFVIGFALQDTLSNFASGLMILVYRPFDVGDAVEAGGVTGTVSEMNLVSTMVLTFDNQLLIVPNKQVWGGIIRNITHQETRRVDLTFGIGYSDDIPKAEKVLTEIVTSHEKVLKDPEPVIKLHELGESSVNFVVRPWSKTEDYWDVYWDITREVKRRFDEEGISIPFPQRDVHIYNEGGAQKS